MRIQFTLVLTFLFLTAIQGQNKQYNIDDFKWDLSTLYDESVSFEKQVEQLHQEKNEIKKLEGQISQNVENLEMVLDRVSVLRGKAAKLVIYTALKENLDFTSKIAQRQFLIALEIEDEIESSTNFINTEVGQITKKEIEDLLIESPSLQKHKKRINRIKREKKYRLSQETERVLLGMKRLWLQSGQTHQSIFENRDLNWPKIKDRNENEISLFPSEFFRIRRSKDLDTRTKGTKIFLEHIEKYKDLLAIQICKRIEAELLIGRSRGFPTGIDAEFFLRDGFPIGATNILRKAALDNKELFQRYCKTISRLNGNLSPQYSDVYIGTASIDGKISLDESIKIVYEATEDLGNQYRKKIDSLLKEDTFHFRMSPTKRIMWAIYPPVGGSKPYTIMPYDESFRASSVLSRAIVGNLAQHHYSPDTRDDPPVYNNAIIYVGSLLHRDYLTQQAVDKSSKLKYLQAAAYGLYNTFFKYAVYASFEYEIESRLLKGEYPDGEDVSNIYYGVLQRYLGDEINLPAEYAYEWMTIAQPFNTYEHQYWPVAMAAACEIVNQIKIPKVNDLLIGKVTEESDRSYQILKEAGIDLMDDRTYSALFSKLEFYLDEIDKLLNK